MPTSLVCPTCSKKLRIPDALLGKRIRCPQCKELVGGAPKPKSEEEQAATRWAPIIGAVAACLLLLTGVVWGIGAMGSAPEPVAAAQPQKPEIPRDYPIPISGGDWGTENTAELSQSKSEDSGGRIAQIPQPAPEEPSRPLEKEKTPPPSNNGGYRPSSGAPALQQGSVGATSAVNQAKLKAMQENGSVSVKGYTRKDGTYVAPYTRSAPKK